MTALLSEYLIQRVSSIMSVTGTVATGYYDALRHTSMTVAAIPQIALAVHSRSA